MGFLPVSESSFINCKYGMQGRTIKIQVPVINWE